jgi:hypothetical protein
MLFILWSIYSKKSLRAFCVTLSWELTQFNGIITTQFYEKLDFYTISCLTQTNPIHKKINIGSSFYLRPFLMVVSSSLRFPYSFLYSEYNDPIHVLGFCTPFVCDVPIVWAVFHNIDTFVLALYSTNEREHMTFGLLSLANFT